MAYHDSQIATKKQLKELMQIPGIGISLANDLWQIDIRQIADLKGKNPEQLYEQSNKQAGTIQDRCVLYTFRCAVYFADTPSQNQESEKLKWWKWKDGK